jgi:hypothetical protein
MNEYEIERYASQFRLHPILGPATQTLVNLVEWVNASSDGWPYWRKPAQAAAKLMGLVSTLPGDDPERAEVTEAQYKAALTPLKAFRTRQERERGSGLRPLFVICEPGKGVGGEVWAAEQAYGEACKLYDEAKARIQVTHELMIRAGNDLNSARMRQNWRELDKRAKDGQPGSRGLDADTLEVIRLAKPGTRLWDLPTYDQDGYHGLGEPATATGVTYGMGGVYVAYVTDSGRTGRTGPMAVMTLAEARERFWITDAEGVNLVSGGHRDRDRMVSLAAGKHPGSRVLPGTAFVPEA